MLVKGGQRFIVLFYRLFTRKNNRKALICFFHPSFLFLLLFSCFRPVSIGPCRQLVSKYFEAQFNPKRREQTITRTDPLLSFLQFLCQASDTSYYYFLQRQLVEFNLQKLLQHFCFLPLLKPSYCRFHFQTITGDDAMQLFCANLPLSRETVAHLRYFLLNGLLVHPRVFYPPALMLLQLPVLLRCNAINEEEKSLIFYCGAFSFVCLFVIFIFILVVTVFCCNSTQVKFMIVPFQSANVFYILMYWQ